MMSVALPVLLVPVLAVMSPEEPSAMVLETSPRVQVRRLAHDAREPARAGLRLAGGDSLFVPGGASVTLLLRNGRVQQLGGDYVVPSASGGQEGLGRVVGAPAPRPAAAGFLRDLGAAVPARPAHDIAVAPGQVTLHWHPAPAAAPYTVRIRRTDVPGYVLIPVGGDTSWTAPAGTLLPGYSYQWTVVGSDDARSSPPVTFRVLGEGEWTRITDEVSSAGSLVTGMEARTLLRLLLYYEAGLLYEASTSCGALGPDALGPGSELRALCTVVAGAIAAVPVARDP
jgi:hypothetical protein